MIQNIKKGNIESWAISFLLLAPIHILDVFKLRKTKIIKHKI